MATLGSRFLLPISPARFWGSTGIFKGSTGGEGVLGVFFGFGRTCRAAFGVSPGSFRMPTGSQTPNFGPVATQQAFARTGPRRPRSEMSTIGLVHGLTDPRTTLQERRELASSFSREFGWRPNDFIEDQGDLTTANLVVEHGLNSAAVLSFLPDGRGLQQLRIDEQKRLLGISYNSFGGLARLDRWPVVRDADGEVAEVTRQQTSWNISILERFLQDWYVRPAEDRAFRAEIDEKLSALVNANNRPLKSPPE